jgi:hypothetical protein
VTVATGIVGDLPVSAPVTLLDVSAEFGGPAVADVLKGSSLLLREGADVSIKKVAAVLPEDVGNFERRPVHGCASPGKG